MAKLEGKVLIEDLEVLQRRENLPRGSVLFECMLLQLKKWGGPVVKVLRLLRFPPCGGYRLRKLMEVMGAEGVIIPPGEVLGSRRDPRHVWPGLGRRVFEPFPFFGKDPLSALREWIPDPEASVCECGLFPGVIRERYLARAQRVPRRGAKCFSDGAPWISGPLVAVPVLGLGKGEPSWALGDLEEWRDRFVDEDFMPSCFDELWVREDRLEVVRIKDPLGPIWGRPVRPQRINAPYPVWIPDCPQASTTGEVLPDWEHPYILKVLGIRAQ